jgi:HK97 family phage major capsid protein
MRELQAQILQKSKEAQALTEGENVDITKAATLMDEVDALQKEFETLERVEKSKKAGVPAGEGAPGDGTPKVDAVKAFADAVRSRFKANMNEGTGADGGYTVPQDISTQVNTLREEFFSLASLIDHETVSTNSGRRTYKTRAKATGFSLVGEGAAIGQAGQPKFDVINYSIKKYAGYMPVTNELLEDSDAAIASTMIEWLAKEGVATENAQILAAIKTKAATALTGIKDIKNAINVTLAAFAGSVRIVTNSDGLQYLDTLEDKNGRPLLSPDPVKPMEMYLSVGVRRIPVTVVPNDVLATDSGKIPFIMGDLHEYMKQFDRKQLTLMTSNTAAVTDFNAFEQDMTLIRAIMRADWVVKDDQAIVRGELTVA